MSKTKDKVIDDLNSQEKPAAPTEGTLQKLTEDYGRACNAWLKELLRLWELEPDYGYWIGGEVGGIYAYGDSIFITMEDIILCVREGVTEAQYYEWQDYCCDATEFNLTTPNLRSFIHGCPRTSPETITHLRQLKADLDAAIDDAKQDKNF